MRLAIMQPYIFPYLGYFQLIHAVDKFVFYDDVNFIKGGWINRNKILVNGEERIFTIPLDKASSNKKINEIPVHPVLFDRWKKKFMRSLDQTYGKAPFFDLVRPLVSNVIESGEEMISGLARKSVIAVSDYIGIDTVYIKSSQVYQNSDLRAQERVIDICNKEKASEYINAIGGYELYHSNEFQTHSIDLKFIEPSLQSYQQGGVNYFIKGLSIIDVLMFLPVIEIRQYIKAGTLIDGKD